MEEGTKHKKNLLVVILGPTAVGKTSLSIDLASRYHTEILSADSRQFYREMNIGTAKPSLDEMKNIPHHLIDTLSVQHNYDVRKFEKDARKILSDIFPRKNLVIATGGSGLYIRALCHGLDDMPAGDPEIRKKLEKRIAEEGLQSLVDELTEVDPIYISNADLANPRRVIRALEVYNLTGKPFSSFLKKSKEKRQAPSPGRYKVLKIGLSMDREKLYRRIDERVDEMVAEGLLDEVKSLWPYRENVSLNTVGYQEIIGYLNNEYSWEEAVRLVKRNSRRLAKKQLTWFRRDPGVHWVNLEEGETFKTKGKVIDEITELIEAEYS